MPSSARVSAAQVDTIVAVRIDDGLITGLYAVRNPVELARIEQETALRR
ncbi:hypothetical protein GCM10011588_12320 [Nocardia jinanensis]|uniref:RNA polymerase sigma-70 factor, ECF subfamily n=1 Tax=Nocardia jinanensis TaxID=382504 RepID=A0A917VMK0_9NOCA|nr:hypothetical protein GCM10011588_12320 [Nocardia jinanensis]